MEDLAVFLLFLFTVRLSCSPVDQYHSGELKLFSKFQSFRSYSKELGLLFATLSRGGHFLAEFYLSAWETPFWQDILQGLVCFKGRLNLFRTSIQLLNWVKLCDVSKNLPNSVSLHGPQRHYWVGFPVCEFGQWVFSVY